MNRSNYYNIVALTIKRALYKIHLCFNRFFEGDHYYENYNVQLTLIVSIALII